MIWNNPLDLPEEGTTLLLKTKVLHTEKIRFGVFKNNAYQEKEIGGIFYEPSQIYGWTPFEDSNTVAAEE